VNTPVSRLCHVRAPDLYRRAIAGLALLAAPFLAGTALAQQKPCTIDPDTFVNEPPLVQTRKALAAGDAVTIVAVGGASTLGRAAGTAELAWPARMGVALGERFPGARIEVANLGVPRQTAADMLARFPREVLSGRPTLVIWETGTTDAVRGVDLDEFRATVQAGIDRVLVSRAEIVLMDMQFSRRTHAMINIDRYRDVLRELADANDIPLFRRHALMREWAETGIFEFNVADAEKRKAMAARLYDCIGRGVAKLISQPRPSDAPLHQGSTR
jgi:acyl-CoA thioesterase-1